MHHRDLRLCIIHRMVRADSNRSTTVILIFNYLPRTILELACPICDRAYDLSSRLTRRREYAQKSHNGTAIRISITCRAHSFSGSRMKNIVDIDVSCNGSTKSVQNYPNWVICNWHRFSLWSCHLASSFLKKLPLILSSLARVERNVQYHICLR